jgi:hypothetical protein
MIAVSSRVSNLAVSQVLSKGGIDDIVKLANQASPEVEEKDRRLRIISSNHRRDLEPTACMTYLYRQACSGSKTN